MNYKYDFDTVVDRRGTGSMKWDVPEDEIPMWVADMDFQTAPAIRAAIEKRARHGVFGYSVMNAEWYDSIIGHWKRVHDFEIQRDWLMFCTGVVPAISSVVRKMTTVGENVLIQTPVYNIFFNSIVNNGRNVLESPLVYKDGEYSIDWDDLEEKLARPQTTLMILCNPHNPIGKIWDKDTLYRIGELCAKYRVLVISDEIHCDLTDPGYGYVPFASVSENCKNNSITCIAPTKTFNIAGINTAAISVPEPFIRHKVERGINTDEVAEPNAFAVDAAIAAFNESEDWLLEVRNYLYENKCRVREFIKNELPQIKVVPSDATYLLWLDCHEIADEAEAIAEQLHKHGLYLTDGSHYGESGKAFLRMNVACPRSTLEEGLKRLKKGIDLFVK